MKTFITKLFASLDNHSLGYSGRKLTALFAILVGAVITFYKLPADQQFNALCVWLLVAVLCLGIVTFEQIIKLKNGQKDEQSNQ